MQNSIFQFWYWEIQDVEDYQVTIKNNIYASFKKINVYLYSMKKIEIHNFRCFENLELELNPGINLLIGDNASGKTTILKALRAAMSSFFAGYSDENTRFIGLSESDFTVKVTNSLVETDKPIIVDFDLEGISAILRRNTQKEKRTLTKPLKPISTYAKELQVTLFDNGIQTKALPLFASFSTEDIHSSRKFAFGLFKEYANKPSFGYFECLQGDGFFPYWIKRLLVLKEGEKGKFEISCVKQAIRKSLGANGCNIINKMEIRVNQRKVYYHFIDGREIDAYNLSDGYTRLVNMVTDLAFRCALLNQGIYKEEACLKTEGTVLIDEIDLHLHPTLQSVVIKGLQQAFPKLQFIITTHAPMVMTSVQSNEENIVYKLSYSKEKGYEALPVNLYGMDASTILDVELDTTPRSKEVDDRLKTLFDLIDIDEYVKAAEKLNEMRSEFGDQLPELAKAQAMLNFLSDSEDDSNS